ncbi:30S ribosomal protein S12 methylthiotransferase RimO [Helicobacter sp. MIT 00-7814]|uniref:30S ribosomal protein S12 methylthiotransferase RimO n=1 Tax=unclassified Helicobacter TaxID=2593540 RepID=UPI000E1E99DC|nr:MULTISPECIES: 30S ribosomal protein S12 methylthiotransferase RimO [unclassified Helicobacter]RDU57230.1 30S ribosomal protein S12 methylthiotransferase RimO [Helicobacter sp. MIT 00-7814]RDU57782.1 30S ribosomal protein S12 methylthiotransferase RimO [Helicobacter sp. MIT 99-10781]
MELKAEGKTDAKKLHIISLGCTKNLVDSEVMLGRLKEYEITQDVESADVIIINTCGFIESAKQESIATIFEASNKRKNDAMLVVSGCLSERYYDELKAQIPEIDIITGVGDYDKIDVMLEQKRGLHSKKVFLADEGSERVIVNSTFHAYIKLSEGCNQQCSFCAIPHFKGKLFSRTLDSVIKELESLYNRGFRDFSFIAQDSSSFLRDRGQKDGLIALIEAIDKLNLPITARILYLYPSTTTPALIESIARSSTFLPYFDMPLQHIADSMLKIMNRGANKAYHLKLLKQMREIPNSFVRTSFILGHPGEGEAEFEELCAFVEEFNFDRVNIFEYSPQENTQSFALPQVEKKLTSARIKCLNKILAKQQKAHFHAMLGKNIEVIVEGKSEISPYFYSARSRLWAREIDGEILINDTDLNDVSLLDSNQNLASGAYLCQITQVKDNFVFGKLLERL